MLGSPRHELLVFGEHRVNELVQDVFGRLAKKVRVREVILVISLPDPCPETMPSVGGIMGESDPCRT